MSALDEQLDLARRTACLSRAASWVRALGTPEAGREFGFADSPASWMVELVAALDGLG